jgi:hypothetical protein
MIPITRNAVGIPAVIALHGSRSATPTTLAPAG